MSQPSVLILGCGSIGERHLRCFKATGRVRVTAADAAPATLARMRDSYGVETAGDGMQALRDGRYDVVVICTPAMLHVDLALQALEAGAHVLIEKPLSQSMTGIDRLRETSGRSGRQVAVAYVYHVFPVLVQVREFLARGQLGPILQAVVTTGQPFHRLRPGYAATYYRDHATGGGAIQDALTHAANWIESVLGPADSVLCDCAHLALPEVAVEDTVSVASRHGRAHAHFSLNQFQAPNETSLQLNAAAGSVRIELHRHRWGVFHAGAAEWEWHDVAPVERDGHFIAQANAFLDQVEGRPPTLCSLDAAIQTLRFNLAALASARRGARVACADLS